MGAGQFISPFLNQAKYNSDHLNQSVFMPVPMDLSSILTPAPGVYGRADGLSDATGWDKEWIITGEDGQIHVIDRTELSSTRADRAANYGQSEPWAVEMSSKVIGYNVDHDSRNTWFRGVAKESWTYTDTDGLTKTTGYAVLVGTGDETVTGSGVFRAPTVYFYREGIKAAQSLTKMLYDAGIMDEVYSSPRNLQCAIRSELDEFFVCGAGTNGSTSLVECRPTFGKIVLTLNSAKSRTGASSVSSLTWTDYLSLLQAEMPEGETIINVASMGGQSGNAFYLMVVTEDASDVKRSRLMQFDRSTNTASLIDALKKEWPTDVAIFPVINTIAHDTQLASFVKSTNGVAFIHLYTAGETYLAFYKGDAETSWRNIAPQVKRALGVAGGLPRGIGWDSTNSRFVVYGNAGTQTALLGVLDIDCKQGRPLTEMFPMQKRWPADISRNVFGCYADEKGILVCGSRQMFAIVPSRCIEPKPARVLWGLIVTPSSNADEVNVSAGEAEFYSGGSAKTRKYYAGGAVAVGFGGTRTLVIKKADGTVGRTGNGFKSGTDYPEPALMDYVILATLTNATSGVINASDIDMVTFRDV